MKCSLPSLVLAAAALSVPSVASATPTIVWTPIQNLGTASDVVDIAACQDLVFRLGPPVIMAGSPRTYLGYNALTHTETWTPTLGWAVGRQELPEDIVEITCGQHKLYTRGSYYSRNFSFINGILGGAGNDARLFNWSQFTLLETLGSARHLSMADNSERLWVLNDDNSIWEGDSANNWYVDQTNTNPYTFTYRGAPSTTPTLRLLTVLDDGAFWTLGSDQPIAIGIVPGAAVGSKVIFNRRVAGVWNLATANWGNVTTSTTPASAGTYPAWYIESNLIDLETVSTGSGTYLYGLSALPSGQRILVRGNFTP